VGLELLVLGMERMVLSVEDILVEEWEEKLVDMGIPEVVVEAVVHP
jgi:hypothetical protein